MDNTINWAGKKIYTGGDSGASTLSDDWTNFFNAGTAAIDHTTITVEAGHSISWRIEEGFYGEAEALSWLTGWTDLTADFSVSTAHDDTVPMFVYIREFDGTDSYAVKIYQVFVDTDIPEVDEVNVPAITGTDRKSVV